MDDAFAVCRFDGCRHLQREPHRLVHIQRTAQRQALDVLHDEVVSADVVQRADVRMVERGDGARLALEGVTAYAQALERDHAIQTDVLGLPDLAHAAGADTIDENVRPDCSTCFPCAHGLRFSVNECGEAYEHAEPWMRRANVSNWTSSGLGRTVRSVQPTRPTYMKRMRDLLIAAGRRRRHARQPCLAQARRASSARRLNENWSRPES